MSGSIRPFGSARVGTSPRQTIWPVNFGASGPNSASRTEERMPSAPITTSAVASLPSAKVSVTCSPVCRTPMHFAFSRTHSAGTARCSTACRSARCAPK